MSIWEWALAAYGQPGVPEACLALQDDHGQNVPYLLWAVWAELDDPVKLGEGAIVARTWETVAVGPLRQIRRELKAPLAEVADVAREDLRNDVKSAELKAERVLLEALERIAGPAGGGAPTLRALKAATSGWSAPAPDAALAALARALG